ncbi:MAG: glycosyltransferase family 4 protein [Intrasporangium sp.]|uniref:glycosyltransferase family 4 protein n=1 Tax=Intrasporangium sp. TaxID=1925024 RepID=UPI002647E381|nr:glycosyltransferase family 4 protein [Intrasporangium sp.]MDN5794185.1 glycosyltransferase family 4 protein [Intrasporangium sp.]
MRILQLLGRSAGGIGSHVGRLSHDLRSLGHEVVIVSDRSSVRHFGWTDAHALWPFGSAEAVARAPLDWHRIMRLACTVEVVHAHGQQAALVAAVAVLRARPRPRLVVSLHNEVPADGLGARAIRWALRRADLVAGASDDLVATALRLGARRSELATVASPRAAAILAASEAPDAPDADEGARLRQALLASAGIDAPADRPLVLTVSRIAPQKDLATLVAAARASTLPATWVVVGGGDAQLRRRLESEVGGIPLTFVGARGDVEAWLRAATVLVLTSRWEARALVVQEALAAGVPVVVPAVGGLPGLVGDAGVLVPPADPTATATAVDDLLRDPSRRADLAARARARARTWATPEQEARQWARRYESLTGP